jgi:hypothetical protein
MATAANYKQRVAGRMMANIVSVGHYDAWTTTKPSPLAMKSPPFIAADQQAAAACEPT